MPRTMIYHKTPETKLNFFSFSLNRGCFCYFDYGYQGDISNGLGDTWLVWTETKVCMMHAITVNIYSLKAASGGRDACTSPNFANQPLHIPWPHIII